MTIWIMLLILVLPGTNAYAVTQGNPDAVKGGVMSLRLSAEPANLNPITSKDYYEGVVDAYIYESLLEADIHTYEFIPRLARTYEISEDYKTFTFHLHPAARFHDGKRVTPEDVKYSYEVIFKEVGAAALRPYFASVISCDVLDSLTVQFKVKDTYYKNFESIGTYLIIVPKHIFEPFFALEDKTKASRNMNTEPLGSGPYRFDRWKKGKDIILIRDPDYWGNALPQNIGHYNVGKIIFKIVMENKVAYEMFKKGDLDIYSFTYRQWIKESGSPIFGTKLDKADIVNKQPADYSFIAWNNEKPPFNDRRIRKAMSHLVDVDLFTRKFSYGFTEQTRGAFGNHSVYSSPEIKPIKFDVTKAVALLREAGWDDHDGDGVMDRGGEKFEFTILTPPGEEGEAQLAIIQQDMRKAGVVMHFKVVEWNSFVTKLDDHDFDAVTLAFTRAVNPDPASIFHSSSTVKGGNNFFLFKNSVVDSLITIGINTFDKEERIRVFRKIDEIIYEEQPMTFLDEYSHYLLGFSLKFEKPALYYDYAIGYTYWFIPKEKQ